MTSQASRKRHYTPSLKKQYPALWFAFERWVNNPTAPRFLEAFADCMVSHEIAAHMKKLQIHEPEQSLPIIDENE